MVGHRQLIFVDCSYLIFLVVISMFSSVSVQAAAATVNVTPPSVIVEPGQNFNVDISISDVFDLYGWEAALSWNPSLLEAVSMIEGSFLKADGTSTFFTYNISAIDGRTVIDCTRIGWGSGVSGGGILAKLTFLAKDYGGCTLDLYAVSLINSSEQPIFCQALDGQVKILTPGHDLAIMTVLPIKQIVGKGYTMIINVTALNCGIFDEISNLSNYVNTTVQTQTLNIQSAEVIILTFLFDTTTMNYGNFSISAFVLPVPNETDTADNNYTCAISVYVGVPGDVNADGRVDMKDIASVAVRFYASMGQPLYHPNYDIIWDGRIDMKDIAIAAKNFGKTIT